MSFEDIEVARAARAAKEVIKGKGKRGRKRKSAALEADEPEPEPEVARMTEVPEPWRAPGGAGDLKRRLRRIDCCKRNRKSLLCSVEVGVCILSWSADSARLSFFP